MKIGGFSVLGDEGILGDGDLREISDTFGDIGTKLWSLCGGRSEPSIPDVIRDLAHLIATSENEAEPCGRCPCITDTRWGPNVDLFGSRAITARCTEHEITVQGRGLLETCTRATPGGSARGGR